MEANLRDDSSDSGRGFSTQITFKATSRTPHWRIEDVTHKTHKPAASGIIKVLVRVRFRYDEIRYCKIRYNKAAGTPKPTDPTYLDELEKGKILKDSELRVLRFALATVLESQCTFDGINERIDGAVKNGNTIVLTVPTSLLPPVGSPDNLNGCAQILIISQ
ncbi:unnamed protein product [Bursaphelenchus xylophilus]|uniref:(pine wood nematode) hypothetical protein n=1 Tax=Bursaphelenchus xylophilus TaxID=6326 RepID=A0A1I7RTP7_BURXY|nr:unnamed protein product [Bursaphelenchus xylophilus]CAG9122237.1 unnamed protein product [Bursaphelenchus xylophilus]